jgi:hypothetical protein
MEYYINFIPKYKMFDYFLYFGINFYGFKNNKLKFSCAVISYCNQDFLL